MNTDLAIYIIGCLGLIVGYILGRWDRKENYVDAYRRGFSSGKLVGQNVALRDLENGIRNDR